MSNLGPGATLLLWLGPINVFLGLFNLVPGFPLDGGRVLRSILWWSTGDMVKATRLASTAGQVFAWVLMGVGALDLFGGNFVGGLWLVLIGWFLNNAARASFQQVLIRRTLEHVPVARMMSTNVEGVPPDLSVDAFVREHLLGGDQQAFPVIQNGQFIGLIGFEDVRSVPHEAWPTTAVGTVMTPSDRVFTLLPQAGAEEALDDLARLDVDQIPVVDHGNVMGFVRRRDLVRWIALQGAA
jgi:CBS domain-containing protein